MLRFLDDQVTPAPRGSWPQSLAKNPDNGIQWGDTQDGNLSLRTIVINNYHLYTYIYILINIKDSIRYPSALLRTAPFPKSGVGHVCYRYSLTRRKKNGPSCSSSLYAWVGIDLIFVHFSNFSNQSCWYLILIST